VNQSAPTKHRQDVPSPAGLFPPIAPHEFISVIVPAWNAERYLDRTIESIVRQSHRNLEIIIVDDGSTDRTPSIAEDWARKDPRIRLVRKGNGGVASARNAGIAAARGRLVAPCDADDLWGPYKLETQLAAWRRAGPRVGLVYSWSVTIGERDRVWVYGDPFEEEGDVFLRMCQGNLIGNGSAAMMLRQAVLDAGGYDSSLRARGAQGCEDLELYIEIARNYNFAVDRSYAVAYRQTGGNMSSDLRQMLRSYDTMMADFLVRHPENAADFAFGRACLLDWLRFRALVLRKPGLAIEMHRRLARQDFAFSIKSIHWTLIRPAIRRAIDRIGSIFRDRHQNEGSHQPIGVPFLGTPGSGALWESGSGAENAHLEAVPHG